MNTWSTQRLYAFKGLLGQAEDVSRQRSIHLKVLRLIRAPFRSIPIILSMVQKLYGLCYAGSGRAQHTA